MQSKTKDVRRFQLATVLDAHKKKLYVLSQRQLTSGIQNIIQTNKFTVKTTH